MVGKTLFPDSVKALPQAPPVPGASTADPRDHVRLAIEECVMQATVARIDSNGQETMAQRFLEHADQRFRLSYLLGTKWSDSAADSESDELTDEDPSSAQQLTEDPITAADETNLRNHLSDYLNRIQTMADQTRAELQGELNLPEDEARKDWDVFQELFEERVQENQAFIELVDEILEDVETRFSCVEQGKFEFAGDNWPTRWCFTTSERGLFLKTVNRFSSNYAPHFGRLLTPLVEGIRVAGPFSPAWHDQDKSIPMVLVDGEGLGHTADSASSISTAVTRRFESVDVVLLVDNAA